MDGKRLEEMHGGEHRQEAKTNYPNATVTSFFVLESLIFDQWVYVLEFGSLGLHWWVWMPRIGFKGLNSCVWIPWFGSLG